MSNGEMEAMMKAASPGEPQKKLARLAGDWTFTNTMWMAPGQPPMTRGIYATMHRGRRFDRNEVGDVRRTTLAGHAPSVEQATPA